MRRSAQKNRRSWEERKQEKEKERRTMSSPSPLISPPQTAPTKPPNPSHFLPMTQPAPLLIQAIADLSLEEERMMEGEGEKTDRTWEGGRGPSASRLSSSFAIEIARDSHLLGGR